MGAERLCFDSLQKIRKRDEDGNLEPGYDEDILPHQLKHANDRHKVKARTACPMHLEGTRASDELAGTNAKRKMETPGSASSTPWRYTRTMRAIAKKKRR